ncbi:mitochondrial ribosomal protein L12 precursor, putative [Plasmodium malariae]|uniref:Mitochondrial ribosomal protein L12, putative n=1 Tax=Plasmodium malariae TaxID=5858 RepID=A0A1D3JJ20_PLAMA|nr:mitochondrial ribosomal protein L12 precursor, putative [Plasmodium malariae]SBT86506.1 mitochondrial ribosomal protein L12 precursor, putative [Plasmodium malariae]
MKKSKFPMRKYFSIVNLYDVIGCNSISSVDKCKRSSKIIFKKYYSSSFNIFDKIKDVSGNNTNENEEDIDLKKRKPSKKVLKLVDEILNLTLIEAADLCDICQEKLEGNKNFNNSYLVHRNPFPHPSNFFGATHFPPLNNSQINMNNNNNNNNNNSSVYTGSNSEHMNMDTTKLEKDPTGGTKKEEKKKTKSTFNIKLEQFDVKNKINTIKEIRKITNVGLKEAKDMVESAPFYIQKSELPLRCSAYHRSASLCFISFCFAFHQKAEEMKKRFEELGATIILD